MNACRRGTMKSRKLPNRIVMPPMTRSRASQSGDKANELMAEYYAQRASAGLIVSEGTWISPMGKGYALTPGIYTQAQIAGWLEGHRRDARYRWAHVRPALARRATQPHQLTKRPHTGVLLGDPS